jgi:hypothetical protein
MIVTKQEANEKERRGGIKTAGPKAVRQPSKQTAESGVLALQRAAGNHAVSRLLQPDMAANRVPPIVEDVLKSESGQPLEPSTRSSMEAQFREDFSQVRVHNNKLGVESARTLNALAYAVGSHIVFDEGQYTPNTAEGQSLLAHELTHVIQQQVTGPKVQLASKRERPSGTTSADRETPIPNDLKKARKEIMAWVAAEKKPTSEFERLGSEDPDSPEHNFRVAFAVNYALKTAGAKPGKDYTTEEYAKLSEKALWILTKDLRQADPKIGTSESLVLRDAQRYFYGSLGDKWLQQHVLNKYKKRLPDEMTPFIRYLPGKVIDRGYEQVVKKYDMVRNAIEEERTGKNPGHGRGRKNMPHSRPGGEAWYDLGQARFQTLNPDDGSKTKSSPFIVTTPLSFHSVEPAFQGREDAEFIHYPGERINKRTGEFQWAPGPKW